MRPMHVCLVSGQAARVAGGANLRPRPLFLRAGEVLASPWTRPRKSSASACRSLTPAMAANRIGAPITTGREVPMRARTSWKISEMRRVWLRWLAIWNRRLFCPPNQTGTTSAFERWMSCETNGCQRASTAGLRPSLSGAVDTAPAGKTTTTPPLELRARRRARRQIDPLRLFGFAEVDRQDEALHLGGPHQHRVGQHDKIRPNLADEPRNHDSVQHAVGVIRHHHDRTGLRNRHQRVVVVADVEREGAHRRLPKAFVWPGKALVLKIHFLQLRLAGRLFDETNEAALQRRVGRGRVAEQVFVHRGNRVKAYQLKYLSHATVV